MEILRAYKTEQKNRRGNRYISIYEIEAGKMYGYLTITGKVAGSGKTKWHYVCECGNTGTIFDHNLKRGLINGKPYSCGCRKGVGSHHLSKENQIGKKYNRLTILEFIDSTLGKRRVRCQCDCGNIIECFLSALKKGNTHSCGCYAKEQQSKSGSQMCDSNQKRSGARNWTYRGVRYRSGLEVMYAAYLVNNGIRFEYEPRRFTLDTKTRYKPDFYLLDEDKWVEVKGYLSPSAEKKAELFRTGRNYELLLLKQVEAKYGKTYSSFIYWWDRGIRPE